MTDTIFTSKWANRFTWAAIVHMLLAAVWTFLIVTPLVKPSLSRIIAGGGPGTWFFVGYVMYIVAGVVGFTVTAVFYNHLETYLKKTFKGVTDALAWLHFILMNVGVVGATWLLMIAGYTGGAAIQPMEVGGWGLKIGQVHPLIVGYVKPIGYLVIITCIGVVIGIINYVTAYTKK